jgi:hypothetical protein
LRYVVDASEPRQWMRPHWRGSNHIDAQRGGEIDMASSIRAEIVLARYKAGQLFRQQLREAGRKLPPYRELQAGADELFEKRRTELIAWAVTKLPHL